jgi:hypothetical protein
MEVTPMGSRITTDRYPPVSVRRSREPEFEICERCDAEISTDPDSVVREVQCKHCGCYHCTMCDFEHACPGTDTCSACNKRTGRSKLTLVSCDCDEELCPACLAAHTCKRPVTFSAAIDAWNDDLASSLVGGGK